MHEQRATIFELERQIAVVAIRLQQQHRIIGGLPDGPERIEALSEYAELLREEHDLERNRAQLNKQLSAYSWSGVASTGMVKK